jgi:hypothetical protein
MSKPKRDPNVPYNRDTQLEPTNCCEGFTFSFLNKILSSGSKQPYQYDMLYKVKPEFTLGPNKAPFKRYLDERVQKNGKLSFWDIYFYCKKFSFAGGILQMTSKLSQFFIPIFFKKFVIWLMDPEKGNAEGYRTLGILIALMFAYEYIGLVSDLYLQRYIVYAYNIIQVRF